MSSSSCAGCLISVAEPLGTRGCSMWPALGPVSFSWADAWLRARCADRYDMKLRDSLSFSDAEPMFVSLLAMRAFPTRARLIVLSERCFHHVGRGNWCRAMACGDI